jgi:AraC-like DNA-binding protein
VSCKVVSGAGAWSVRYERYAHPAFCLVLDGACFLDLDGVGVLDLQRGDFVLLPETPGFTLATDLKLTPEPRAPVQAATLHHGAWSRPVTMRLLGGYFQFDHANARLLVSLLPEAVHIRRDETGAARLQRIAELIGEEADTQRPGREHILERLIEVLLVEALRLRLAVSATQGQGLLAGLSDPALARPLRELHVDMARRWTVAELARTAGMSRAVFAERFTRKVGMPPMQYLLEWRMALAKELLRCERPPLAAVAQRVGYRSTTAFSTAFTRVAGCSPRAFVRAMG